MSEQKKKKFDNKKFVRYAEGAEMVWYKKS